MKQVDSHFSTFLEVLSDPNPQIIIKGECILRYIVEIKGRPTFTSSKKDLSLPGAKQVVERLKNNNKKEGYNKYSSFKLYSKNNILIQGL